MSKRPSSPTRRTYRKSRSPLGKFLDRHKFDVSQKHHEKQGLGGMALSVKEAMKRHKKEVYERKDRSRSPLYTPDKPKPKWKHNPAALQNVVPQSPHQNGNLYIKPGPTVHTPLPEVKPLSTAAKSREERNKELDAIVAGKTLSSPKKEEKKVEPPKPTVVYRKPHSGKKPAGVNYAFNSEVCAQLAKLIETSKLVGNASTKNDFNTLMYNYVDRYFFSNSAEVNRKSELDRLKTGNQPPTDQAIKDLIALSIKAKWCFISEYDDFDGKSDDEIQSHVKSKIDEALKKDGLLKARFHDGVEMPVMENIKAIQKHFVCSETCLSNMSIAYKQKQSTILTQVNRIHRKLGFCPIRLEFTDEPFKECHVTDELVTEFLKGGAKINKPFRSIGTLLYNKYCIENEQKFLKCVIFSPKVRAFTNYDQVFELNVKDLPNDIHAKRAEKYFNCDYNKINWIFKSQRDQVKTFDAPRDLILYMLQTV